MAAVTLRRSAWWCGKVRDRPIHDARWAPDVAPFLWIFADRDAAHWRTVTDLARQANTSVLTGTGGK